MQTTETFVIWLSNIHNEVNSALGKPQVGKRESDNQYVKNGKLNFDFKDFVILFRIITMINYVNFPAIQKLIQLVFDIYPDKVFLKNAPNSYKSINTIQNNQTLNTWITYFDAEFAKNRKTQPYLNTPNIIPRIVEVYIAQNRPDLAEKEQVELTIIEEFLPKQLSDSELTERISAIIAQLGATSPGDMGKVMGVASKELAGLAEGRAISSKVGELLKK